VATGSAHIVFGEELSEPPVLFGSDGTIRTASELETGAYRVAGSPGILLLRGKGLVRIQRQSQESPWDQLIASPDRNRFERWKKRTDASWTEGLPVLKPGRNVGEGWFLLTPSSPALVSLRTENGGYLALYGGKRVHAYRAGGIGLTAYLDTEPILVYWKPQPGSRDLILEQRIPVDFPKDREWLFLGAGEEAVFRFSVGRGTAVGVAVRAEGEILEIELYDRSFTRLASGPLFYRVLAPENTWRSSEARTGRSDTCPCSTATKEPDRMFRKKSPDRTRRNSAMKGTILSETANPGALPRAETRHYRPGALPRAEARRYRPGALPRAEARRYRPGALPRVSSIAAAAVMLLLASALSALDWSVKPETYLRGWDPITVDIGTDKGPAAGGPCDDPGELLPDHPLSPRRIPLARLPSDHLQPRGGLASPEGVRDRQLRQKQGLVDMLTRRLGYPPPPPRETNRFPNSPSPTPTRWTRPCSPT
jgi:hypothetical protein